MGRGPNWQWNRRRESKKISYNDVLCILRMPVTRRFFFNLLLWRTYSNWAFFLPPRGMTQTLWVPTPKKRIPWGEGKAVLGLQTHTEGITVGFAGDGAYAWLFSTGSMEIISKWESFRNRKLKKKLGHQPKPLTDYRDCDKSNNSLQNLKL